MSADFDELVVTLREFARRLVDQGDAETLERGVAGAARERARASAGHDLLALLDKLPAPAPLTSPDRIPPAIRASLDRYVTGGIRPGHCLQAILCDELFEAFKRADPTTAQAMPAIVAYVRGELPAGCWGCEALVEAWIARPRS